MDFFTGLTIFSGFLMIMAVILSVLFIINIINPRLFWEKFEGWKAKEEPSKAYFRARRIQSVIALIILIFIIIFPSLMAYIGG